MSKNNSRRVMLVFKYTSMANKELAHGDAMKLVWRFLTEKEDYIQHHFAEKPYVWHVVPNERGLYSLVFSSIFPEITKDFYEAVKKVENIVLEVNSSMVDIVSISYIADIDYIGPHLRISSYDLVCQKNARKGKIAVDVEDKEAFCEAIKSRLIRRAKLFFDLDVSEKDITIKYPKKTFEDVKEYKGSIIPVQNAGMILIAPRQVIELALYSGIGSKSGSGFGMVYSA